jgi:uncharacterized cupredoxin-like copper-binding protein
MKRRTAVVLVAVAAVAIGACGGGSDDEKSGAGGTEKLTTEFAFTTLNVTAKEFSYEPAKLTLKAGEGSAIVLKNIGSIEHDIAVDDARFKLTVPGNKTREKVLTIDKPGTYRFYCSVSGHKDAGMKGELTVT